MKYVICVTQIFAIIFSMGCNEKTENLKIEENKNCRGAWTFRDQYGDLKKKNEYFHSGFGRCVTESMALTNYEKGIEKRRRTNITCERQSGFPEISLRAANNFYQYRDSKVYLNFNSNGEFRKIILGEDKGGLPVFSRTLGCYWQRTGVGIDAQFGNQLYLDGPRGASTNLSHRKRMPQI